MKGEYMKANTIEQYKILQYIHNIFTEGSLNLSIDGDRVIIGTDRNGNTLAFYYDYDSQEVHTQDM
jgi:hypothetical protein